MKLKLLNGFTLAEVLITLGIIGVVAAVTMPTLIQNHQKQVYVTGLKRGISVVDNMFKKMQADEGVSNFSDTTLATDGICQVDIESCSDLYGDLSVFENIIPKYLKTVRICKRYECSIIYSYPSPRIYDYSNLSKTDIFEIVGQHSYGSNWMGDALLGFYTTDGAIYYIAPGSNYRGVLIAIDVNGEKRPNQLGRDLFTMYYYRDKLIPSESSGDNGRFTERIMQNGWKMDY